jgi:hypothetical protein
VFPQTVYSADGAHYHACPERRYLMQRSSVSGLRSTRRGRIGVFMREGSRMSPAVFPHQSGGPKLACQDPAADLSAVFLTITVLIRLQRWEQASLAIGRPARG